MGAVSSKAERPGRWGEVKNKKLKRQLKKDERVSIVLLSITIMHSRTLPCGHVRNEVEDFARVSPLIVIPGDELYEVVVQRDASLGIEHRGAHFADKVARHNILVGVSEDAVELAL